MDEDSEVPPHLVVRPLPFFYEEFDGGRRVSHQMQPLPSAMSVIESKVHCLGIKSSEVKPLCLPHPGPRMLQIFHVRS